MDRADFPWQPLGRILVDDELLTPTELERALAVQRETGRLLGEILVEQGSMSGASLAQALARQHGVELEPSDLGDEPVFAAGPASKKWRPLGAVLVESGLVAEADLEEALAEKRKHQDRRLGEILVRRGHLSPSGLALALAEQHGVSLEAEGAETEEQRVATVSAVRSYRVCLVGYKAKAEQRTLLYESPNLLDAADFACEYVDREEPVAVEIERLDGDGSEIVWTYSRDRAEAEAASSKPLVETFGFDPTLWSGNS
jgi:adenylate cyclase